MVVAAPHMSVHPLPLSLSLSSLCLSLSPSSPPTPAAIALPCNGRRAFFGLDGCGKTSLIHVLAATAAGENAAKGAALVCPPPTASIEKRKLKLEAPIDPATALDVKALTVADTPGGAEHREQWFLLPFRPDGLVFVVDTTDPMRFPLACESLSRIVQGHGTHLPLLLLLNKQDSPLAADAQQLVDDLRANCGGGPIPVSELRWSGCSAIHPALPQQQQAGASGALQEGGLLKGVAYFLADIRKRRSASRILGLG